MASPLSEASGGRDERDGRVLSARSSAWSAKCDQDGWAEAPVGEIGEMQITLDFSSPMAYDASGSLGAASTSSHSPQEAASFTPRAFDPTQGQQSPRKVTFPDEGAVGLLPAKTAMAQRRVSAALASSTTMLNVSMAGGAPGVPSSQDLADEKRRSMRNDNPALRLRYLYTEAIDALRDVHEHVKGTLTVDRDAAEYKREIHHLDRVLSALHATYDDPTNRKVVDIVTHYQDKLEKKYNAVSESLAQRGAECEELEATLAAELRTTAALREEVASMEKGLRVQTLHVEPSAASVCVTAVMDAEDALWCLFEGEGDAFAGDHATRWLQVVTGLLKTHHGAVMHGPAVYFGATVTGMFADAGDALEWCKAVGEALMALDWPAAFESTALSPYRTLMHPDGETALFRGVGVKFGVDVGTVHKRDCPGAGGDGIAFTGYVGHALARSHRAAADALNGEVLLTPSAVDALKGALKGRDDVEVFPVSKDCGRALLSSTCLGKAEAYSVVYFAGYEERRNYVVDVERRAKLGKGSGLAAGRAGQREFWGEMAETKAIEEALRWKKSYEEERKLRAAAEEDVAAHAACLAERDEKIRALEADLVDVLAKSAAVKPPTPVGTPACSALGGGNTPRRTASRGIRRTGSSPVASTPPPPNASAPSTPRRGGGVSRRSVSGIRRKMQGRPTSPNTERRRTAGDGGGGRTPPPTTRTLQHAVRGAAAFRECTDAGVSPAHGALKPRRATSPEPRPLSPAAVDAEWVDEVASDGAPSPSAHQLSPSTSDIPSLATPASPPGSLLRGARGAGPSRQPSWLLSGDAGSVRGRSPRAGGARRAESLSGRRGSFNAVPLLDLNPSVGTSVSEDRNWLSVHPDGRAWGGFGADAPVQAVVETRSVGTEVDRAVFLLSDRSAGMRALEMVGDSERVLEELCAVSALERPLLVSNKRRGKERVRSLGVQACPAAEGMALVPQEWAVSIPRGVCEACEAAAAEAAARPAGDPSRVIEDLTTREAWLTRKLEDHFDILRESQQRVQRLEGELAESQAAALRALPHTPRPRRVEHATQPPGSTLTLTSFLSEATHADFDSARTTPADAAADAVVAVIPTLIPTLAVAVPPEIPSSPPSPSPPSPSPPSPSPVAGTTTSLSPAPSPVHARPKSPRARSAVPRNQRVPSLGTLSPRLGAAPADGVAFPWAGGPGGEARFSPRQFTPSEAAASRRASREVPADARGGDLAADAAGGPYCTFPTLEVLNAVLADGAELARVCGQSVRRLFHFGPGFLFSPHDVQLLKAETVRDICEVVAVQRQHTYHIQHSDAGLCPPPPARRDGDGFDALAAERFLAAVIQADAASPQAVLVQQVLAMWDGVFEFSHALARHVAVPAAGVAAALGRRGPAAQPGRRMKGILGRYQWFTEFLEHDPALRARWDEAKRAGSSVPAMSAVMEGTLRPLRSTPRMGKP